MDESEFEKYLKERYKNQISWYEKRSKSCKNWFRYLEIVLIICSAMTPILIVIDYISEAFTTLRWISILTSVLTVVLASLIRTFKFQEHWINYRTTVELLKKEQYYFKANANEYGTVQDKKALFVKRVENLISQAHTKWIDEYKLHLEAEE
ncbi:MAG: DUF4231 domain-containing protein [Promethearchaeota archaeon]|nr:MAG: DUF4231 domain-containing protein [Candidatus Lokiarchaeota archaeon]